MSFLVLSGQHCYPDRWNDFRGHFSTMREVEEQMSVRLAMDDEWFQVIDADTWRVSAEFEAQHQECPSCGGKGYITTWLNSVGADKIVRPVAHNFDCTKCVRGRRTREPKKWMPV